MKIFKNPIFYIFSLFMLDYFLTYYGIRIGAIYEGNPLWVKILNLPLYLGLPFRVLYFAVLIYFPVRTALAYPKLCRPIFVKIFYAAALGSNMFILGVHLYWIILYGLVT